MLIHWAVAPNIYYGSFWKNKKWMLFFSELELKWWRLCTSVCVCTWFCLDKFMETLQLVRIFKAKFKWRLHNHWVITKYVLTKIGIQVSVCRCVCVRKAEGVWLVPSGVSVSESGRLKGLVTRTELAWSARGCFHVALLLPTAVTTRDRWEHAVTFLLRCFAQQCNQIDSCVGLWQQRTTDGGEDGHHMHPIKWCPLSKSPVPFLLPVFPRIPRYQRLTIPAVEMQMIVPRTALNQAAYCFINLGTYWTWWLPCAQPISIKTLLPFQSYFKPKSDAWNSAWDAWEWCC